MTDTEKKLVKLLRGMEGIDNDFGLLVCLTCRDENLTEELVEYIEKNNITHVDEVDAWLFGEPEKE